MVVSGVKDRLEPDMVENRIRFDSVTTSMSSRTMGLGSRGSVFGSRHRAAKAVASAAIHGKLKTIETTNRGGTSLECHSLSYLDGTAYVNGHRTRKAMFLKGPSGTPTGCEPSCTQQFTYDGRDRLVRFDNGAGGAIDYAFDGDALAGIIERGTVTPSILKAGNVTTERDTTVTPAATRTYHYDGNRLSRSQERSAPFSHYHYDSLGRLDCTTAASGSAADCSPADGNHATTLLADYAYDPLDRLLSYRSF